MMEQISPKERLFRVLAKKSTDRRPVICPGGMMNAAVVEIMESTGHALPAAHSNEKLMLDLAQDVHEQTGFENFGIPFCMTVEPEVMGSAIDLGTLDCEPKIAGEAFGSVAAVEYRDVSQMLQQGRIGVLAQTAYKLHKANGDVPVIGSLTGPVSTAAALVDPMVFLKELRKDQENAHRVLEYVTDFLIEYAKLLLDNGADLISIADPTATGEILGPKMFEEYAVPYLNRLVAEIHGLNKKALLHICGNLKTVWRQIAALQADAISTDAMVSLKKLKADFPGIVTMGNLSTYLLESGEPDEIAKKTEKLLLDKVDIIAPACGLSTSSALRNLQTFTKVVKAQ